MLTKMLHLFNIKYWITGNTDTFFRICSGFFFWWTESSKEKHFCHESCPWTSICFTRGRPPIIFTLTLHGLLHVTPDYISHVPFHWLRLQLQPITHTIKISLKQPFIAEYCLAFIALLVIATLRSLSEFPDSSLVLFIVWFLESCILVCLSHPVCLLPVLKL